VCSKIVGATSTVRLDSAILHLTPVGLGGTALAPSVQFVVSGRDSPHQIDNRGLACKAHYATTSIRYNEWR